MYITHITVLMQKCFIDLVKDDRPKVYGESLAINLQKRPTCQNKTSDLKC